MSSWGAVPVLSGFSFDTGAGRLGFRPRVRADDRFRCLWSGPNAWGTIEITEGAATLDVLGGTLTLASLMLPLHGAAAVEVRLDGVTVEATAVSDTIRLGRTLALDAGATLAVRAPTISVRDLTDVDAIERQARAAAGTMPDREQVPVGASVP
jgi:hypothetical protein